MIVHTVSKTWLFSCYCLVVFRFLTQHVFVLQLCLILLRSCFVDCCQSKSNQINSCFQYTSVARQFLSIFCFILVHVFVMKKKTKLNIFYIIQHNNKTDTLNIINYIITSNSIELTCLYHQQYQHYNDYHNKTLPLLQQP